MTKISGFFFLTMLSGTFSDAPGLIFYKSLMNLLVMNGLAASWAQVKWG